MADDVSHKIQDNVDVDICRFTFTHDVAFFFYLFDAFFRYNYWPYDGNVNSCWHQLFLFHTIY